MDDKERELLAAADGAPTEAAPVSAGEGEEAAPPDIPSELPVLPVRDIVVFNYMILPLFVGRDKSVQAVDAALNGSRYILVLTQKDEKVDEPGPDDLYRVAEEIRLCPGITRTSTSVYLREVIGYRVRPLLRAGLARPRRAGRPAARG